MKKFLIKIIFLSPILIAVIVINYIGDAANLFHPDYEKKIATYLLKKYNVTNVFNANERILQKYIIEGYSNCPDVITLGSSRTMLINAGFFPGKKFINNSVSGACLED